VNAVHRISQEALSKDNVSWGISISDTADFFRALLDKMVHIKHPLVVLSKRLP